MADEFLADNQRYWDEGDTPILTVTIQDNTGTAIPLANVLTLTLTQWTAQNKAQPGITFNGRNAQNVLNTNNVTVNATTGLVTWSLQPGDTAMQSKDPNVLEEKHYFRFDLTYSSGGTQAKSYPDYYVVTRKQAVR